jgi:bis(5'-adenosyl)-triphosphatase
VLVCSTRPVPRLADLRTDELAELMSAVQRVGRVVERAYKADGLTFACQV